jgi:UMF1 family MFS transporter
MATDRSAPMLEPARGLDDSRPGQLAWAFFEWARNPFYILIWIYIFAPYFSNQVVGDPVRGQIYWLRINWIGSFLIAVVAPFLGAFADGVGHKKPWIGVFVLTAAPCLVGLWWAMPAVTQQGLPLLAIAGLLIVANIALEFSAVLHNAMLPSIASGRRIAELSGLGLALGNAGALLILIWMLYGLALPGLVDWSFIPDQPWFGLDRGQHEPSRLSGPLVGLWLVAFSLPLMLRTPDRPSTGVSVMAAARGSIAQLLATVRRLRRYENVALYLLARMLYNDGKTAVLVAGGVYAAGVFSWGFETMLVYGIVLSVFAVFGGFLGGWLDIAYGSKRAILISIGGTMLSLSFAVSMTPTEMFFVFPYDPTTTPPLWDVPLFQTPPELVYLLIVIFAAIFITAAYANSRTMLARIAPEEMMAEFFGLYALSGTATAFIGTLLVERITDWFDSQRIGFASILLLLGAGFALMFRVRETRAERVEVGVVGGA